MRNLYRARVPLTIDGEVLTVQFDYDALAAIRGAIGEDDNLLKVLRGQDPKLFSALIAIGLMRNHPDWDAARVHRASPPVQPTVRVLEEALNALYFGPSGPPTEAIENPLMRTLRRLKTIFWSPSRQRSARA